MRQKKSSRLVALKYIVIFIVTVLLLGTLGLNEAQTEDYECDNQWLIDTCVWGCSATEGACGGLCGAAEATCKGLCSATEETCGALCTATEATCAGLCGVAEGTCIGGCYAAGGICEGACNVVEGACYVGCGTATGACYAGISANPWCWFNWGTCEAACESLFNSCTDECDIGCDNCRMDCVSECDIACENCRLPCSNCILDCESGCEIACENCRLPCEEDCQFPCRTIGESCVPIDPGFGQRCADGLSCLPTFGIITDSPTGFTCFSSEADEIFPDDVCLSLYSPKLHQAAIDINTAMSYGTSAGGAFGAQTTTEVGTVYGPDGCYGCYMTECWGGTTDVEASMMGCVGLYTSLDDFRGQSDVFVEEAGIGIVFNTMQVTDLSDGEYIGTADCLSLELSLLPIAATFLTCNTIVDTVGCLDTDGNLVEFSSANEPPEALASADVTSGTAPLTVNFDSEGSFDPEASALYFIWVFGDGSAVEETPTATHTYEVPGKYTAVLTVTDDLDQTDIDAIEITVTEPEVAQPIDDLAARAKSGKVSLVWSPIPDAADYNVFRSTSGGDYELIQGGHVSDYATYLDEGLSDGQTYCYQVRWMDSAGQESPDSNEACATPSTRIRR